MTMASPLRVRTTVQRASIYLLVLLWILTPALAEDWPEWRGAGRRGNWNETGILDSFPTKGLTVAWRTPIRGGFAGPAVSAGRVFVPDFNGAVGTAGVERLLCLDEKTGKILWTREWDADYRGIGYAIGPRATPTVDGDRVYVVGASGLLLCLNVRAGDVIWRKDYVKDFGAEMPTWGIANAALVDGGRVIAIVGGRPDAKVVRSIRSPARNSGGLCRRIPNKAIPNLSSSKRADSGN